MDRFTVETSNLENAASSMEGISSSAMSLADEVKAVNTDNNRNFDFEKPKRIIWASIYNSAEKIGSAGKILTTTVESHTDFQSANSFSKYVETSDISSIPTITVTSSGGTTTSSGSTSSGSYSSGSYSGSSGYSSGSSYSSGSTSVPTNADMSSDTGATVSTSSTTAFEAASTGGLVIESVAFANLTGKSIIESHRFSDDDKTKPAAKYIYEYEKTSGDEDGKLIKFEYDEESGLAKIDDMYAIRCDEKYGKVGDIVVIETKDGLRYECLIMENLEEAADDTVNGIEFYTNLPDKVNKISPNLPNPELNIKKIDNYGQYDNYKDLKIETIDAPKDTSLNDISKGVNDATPDNSVSEQVPSSVTESMQKSDTEVTQDTGSTVEGTKANNSILSLLTEDKASLAELRDRLRSMKDQGDINV